MSKRCRCVSRSFQNNVWLLCDLIFRFQLLQRIFIFIFFSCQTFYITLKSIHFLSFWCSKSVPFISLKNYKYCFPRTVSESYFFNKVCHVKTNKRFPIGFFRFENFQFRNSSNHPITKHSNYNFNELNLVVDIDGTLSIFLRFN